VDVEDGSSRVNLAGSREGGLVQKKREGRRHNEKGGMDDELDWLVNTTLEGARPRVRKELAYDVEA
jgi:hypothetical protein